MTIIPKDLRKAADDERAELERMLAEATDEEERAAIRNALDSLAAVEKAEERDEQG